MTPFVQPSPVGTITSWAGAIVDIPANWFLCNGANGTPDLRDRFVVGSGSTYAPADTGGNVNHNHDFTDNDHSHALPAGSDVLAGIGKDFIVEPGTATGTTNNANGLPPYYSLAYIMYGGN